MSLGLSKPRRIVLLFCLLASGMVVTHAQAQGTQKPRRFIELSETNTAEILTNLNQLTVKKEGIRELDDQLGSFNAFSGRKSLEQRFNAPYMRPSGSGSLPNKTIKELLERKNWALSPEELGTGLTSIDDGTALFGDDKQDAKKSSLQQFYDALNRKGTFGGQNAKQFTDKKSPDSRSGGTFRDDDSVDDPNLPVALRDKAKELRQLVSEDRNSMFSSTHSRSSFENFFGLSQHNNDNAASGAVPKTSVDSFLEQFKKALDGPLGASGMDPGLKSLLPTASTQRPVSVPTLDSYTTHHSTVDPTPGNLNAALERTSLPDVNAMVLNQWNPLYSPTPPKLDLPKYSPPPPINLEFPRRKF
jgi:hypothetical protein